MYLLWTPAQLDPSQRLSKHVTLGYWNVWKSPINTPLLLDLVVYHSCVCYSVNKWRPKQNGLDLAYIFKCILVLAVRTTGGSLINGHYIIQSEFSERYVAWSVRWISWCVMIDSWVRNVLVKKYPQISVDIFIIYGLRYNARKFRLRLMFYPPFPGNVIGECQILYNTGGKYIGLRQYNLARDSCITRGMDISNYKVFCAFPQSSKMFHSWTQITIRNTLWEDEPTNYKEIT